MRTPWRFLADLVSRKPPIDRIGDGSQSGTDEVKAIAYQHEDEGPVRDPADTDIDGSVEKAGPEDSDAIEGSPSVPVATELDVRDGAVGEQVDQAATDTVERVTAAAGTTSEANGPDSPDDSSAHRTGKRTTISQDEGGDDVSGKNETTGTLRRGKRQTQPAGSQAAAKADGVEEPPVIKTALEEMAELDAEIATLRLQLSRKLARQNALLQRLLDRFGA